MAVEKELSKRLISLITKGDKLIQDVEKDVGNIVAAAGSLKELINDFKSRLKGPEDSS